MYLMPLPKGFPLELGISAGSEKTGTMEPTDCRKSFKIALAVYMQYWRVTDIILSSQPSFDCKDCICALRVSCG